MEFTTDNFSLPGVDFDARQKPSVDIDDVILSSNDSLMNMNEIDSLFPSYKDACDLDMSYEMLTNRAFSFDNLDMNNILNQDIISDCMWSSTQLDKNRKRESSWCLSECADPQSVTTNVDLSGVQSPTLESQTLVGCGVLMETNSDTDTDEGEIDVVSSDGDDYYQNKPVGNLKPTLRIEPGSSLLLRRNLPTQQEQQKQRFVYNQTFVDHCYFSPPPPSPTPESNKTFKGMLTPNETSGSSSEDDESTYTKLVRCKVSGSSGSIDKRKIVQAVQSLIKNDRNSNNKTSENVKFRFRMKFKNGSSILAGNSKDNSSSSSASVYRENTRRKSALLNPHCPSPKKMSRVETTVMKGLKEITTNKNFVNSQTRIVTKVLKRGKKSDTSQKCRESRDLHNSMERQRRIDLRKNFNQLKASIPELAVNEKASKLNILKQATDFSQQLTETSESLKADLEKELARHAMLKKKFQILQSYFDSKPLQRHLSSRGSHNQSRRLY